MGVDINDFFKEFSLDDEISDSDYASIRPFYNLFESISRSAHQSVYVIDYYKKGFMYVSRNSLFLSGYSVDEVTEMGYSFYEKVVPPEDLAMLLEINQNGYRLFYESSLEERKSFTISYDFRLIQPNRRQVMVNHKLSPIMLTPSGHVWLALCIVTPSTQVKPGNVYIKVDNPSKSYSYSFRRKHWHNFDVIALSEREKEIMLLIVQGLSNEEIARKIFLNVNTVKFHKKKMFARFKVRSTSEAIAFAYNNNLI